MKDARLFEFLMAPEILDIVEASHRPRHRFVEKPLHLQRAQNREKDALARGQRPIGMAASTALTALLPFGWPVDEFVKENGYGGDPYLHH